MTKLLRTATLKGVALGIALLESLAVAAEHAFAPSRVDYVLDEGAEVWRMWCPPVSDVYSEYELLTF